MRPILTAKLPCTPCRFSFLVQASYFAVSTVQTAGGINLVVQGLTAIFQIGIILVRSSKIPHRLRRHLPSPQIEEERCEHQPDRRSSPNEVARIDSLDVHGVQRKQRRYGEDDKTHNQPINNSGVTLRISGGKKQHRADHEHYSTHLLQKEEEQSRNLGLGRV